MLHSLHFLCKKRSGRLEKNYICRSKHGFSTMPEAVSGTMLRAVKSGSRPASEKHRKKNENSGRLLKKIPALVKKKPASFETKAALIKTIPALVKRKAASFETKAASFETIPALVKKIPASFKTKTALVKRKTALSVGCLYEAASVGLKPVKI